MKKPNLGSYALLVALAWIAGDQLPNLLEHDAPAPVAARVPARTPSPQGSATTPPGAQPRPLRARGLLACPPAPAAAPAERQTRPQRDVQQYFVVVPASSTRERSTSEATTS